MKQNKNIKLTDQRLRTLPRLMKAVSAENMAQLHKWGIQTKTPFEWMTYITEEVGEVAQAISEHIYRDEPAHYVAHEAIQAATLLLKIAEMYYEKYIASNINHEPT